MKGFGITAGLGGAFFAIIGAITGDDILTWSAVGVAAITALVTAGVAAYHKIREAIRIEDAADRSAEIAYYKALKEVLKLQSSLQLRVEKLERTSQEFPVYNPDPEQKPGEKRPK